MTELAGVAHMVIRVEDRKRSKQWYQDVLGFEQRRGPRFSSFVHPSTPFALLLREVEHSIDASSETSQRLDHIALHVPTLDALEEWRATLAERDVEVEIERQPGVGASITLYDPDGLEVELFTPETGTPLDVGGVATGR